MTHFHDVQAIRFRPYTTDERDGQTQVENLLLLNTETGQLELCLGEPPSHQWYGILKLNPDGKITSAHHGVFVDGDLHTEYARIQAPEIVTAGWVMASGGSLKCVQGDPPEGEVAVQVKTTTGAPTHPASAGVPCWVMPDTDLYVNDDGGTNWTKFVKVNSLFVSHIAEFPALGESLATGVMGGRPGKCVGESGEHGTFTALRGKVVAGTAGTGTTTILIEADDNPAFSSPKVLYTLALNTGTEVDDTGLDNPWAAGDIWVRARCTAVGATAPKDVNVFFYFKERAEAF
jgi:hypothetical protein